MRTGRRPRAVAGEMNRQVTIRTVRREPDGGGGWTEKPVDVATVWASVDPLDGRERNEAMQTGMVRPYRFEMRYRADLTAAETLAYDGRVFDVKSVIDPEERHAVLEILADEVPAATEVPA